MSLIPRPGRPGIALDGSALGMRSELQRIGGAVLSHGQERQRGGEGDGEDGEAAAIALLPVGDQRAWRDPRPVQVPLQQPIGGEEI